MSDNLPLVVANHKSNLDFSKFDLWIKKVGLAVANFKGTAIVCPSDPFLSFAKIEKGSNNWNFQLGAQNISAENEGAYTGEVSASQLKDLCTYAIIGHSERRNLFGENDETVATKVKLAKDAGIKPVFCIQDESTPIPDGVKIVAYEPVFAIGTGNPDTPENAKSVSAKIKQKGDYIVLYGGSVNKQNVKSFIEKNVIDGVLVGSASIDADSFVDILNNI